MVTNKELNLKDPIDYNEKIQWLKIYSDTSLWTDLADKFKVRKYVKECGLSHILVELYGVWKKGEEIDFNELPDKFVLKTNNGCGTNIFVHDKNSIDFDKTRALLKEWLKERRGLVDFQPHIWNIDRRIIAEEFLQDESSSKFSSSLIDYKFFCIHGKPYIIKAYYNRKNYYMNKDQKHNGPAVLVSTYDADWNPRPEITVSSNYDKSVLGIPKPHCLNEMLKIASILSAPFAQVRVDLYEVNGKVYFGELTFTPGVMNYFTPKFYLEMGEKIDLSKVKRRKKLFII